MSIHIEVTTAIARSFKEPYTFDGGGPFSGSAVLTFTARDTVYISDVISRDHVTIDDFNDLKRQLVEDFGIKYVYCWRKKGHYPPYPGKVVREEGSLSLWRIVF